LHARDAVRGVVLTLRRIAMVSAAGDYDEAARDFADYHRQVAAATPRLKLAEQWSLFNPAVREAHFAALRRLASLAEQAAREKDPAPPREGEPERRSSVP
jgi:hypothetical protein